MHALPHRNSVPAIDGRVAQHALDHCPDAALLSDAAGRLIYGNRAACDLLGRTPEQLRQCTVEDFLFDRPFFENARWSSETTCRHRDGRSIAVEVTTFPVRCDQASFYWVFVEQLREAHRMEAVGRLVESVSHDFNNLLTAILIYSGLLLSRAPAHSPLRRQAEQINVAAERGRALIAHLLDLGRKSPLRPTVLSLNQVIEELRDMLGCLAGEHITLETSCAPDLGAVRADRTQIERLLVNLTVNARDAMPHHGRLRITTANITAGEQFARKFPGMTAGDYVVLAVSDSGCGMDAETRLHAFEPFFTTGHSGRSAGLGLSIVQEIVRQSGGHIHLESAPGRGTRVRIFLPRVQGEVEEGRAPERCDTKERCDKDAAGPATVLVVEDEDLVRGPLREVLTDCGYRVLEARHPREALRLAREHVGQIDIMLTDLVMPGMTGVELAQRIVAARPKLRVLYVSGYPEDVHVRRLEAGQPFFPKPFTAAAIAAKVGEVLALASPPANPAAVMPVTEGEEGDT